MRERSTSDASFATTEHDITSSPTLSPDKGHNRKLSGSSFLSAPSVAGGISNASTLAFQVSEDALKPDLGTEKDFIVENNKFAYSPGQLGKLLNPKSLQAFIALGGLAGIERGLQTDIDSGLSVDEAALDSSVSFEDAVGYRKKARDFAGTITPRPMNTRVHTGKLGSSDGEPFSDRLRVFGNNELPAKSATPLWRIMWNTYNDTVLILLTIAAAISLALGLYETFGVEHEVGAPPPVDWVEGVAIVVAIVIVVIVGSLNDWQKERAFVRLNAKVRWESSLTLTLLTSSLLERGS